MGDGEEDILQAVVLADSFDSRFKPLTEHTPRCLLPLCNVPLIEYTFELLVLSAVKEIFVLSCSHADKVREYIRGSKWGKQGGSIRIHVIVTQQLLSVGDALREVDAKSIIRSDFILISADTVANVKLQDATNKDAIMTMVVQEASLNHPLRQPEVNPVYVLDSNTKECIHYEHQARFPAASKLVIPAEALAKLPPRGEFEVRQDLLDCRIDICSVEVPALFTENFDYQHIRKDFVQGVLTSDLLGKSIHCHVLDHAYAARASGPKMYAAISQDVLGRWAYPLVPDTNLLGNTTYSYGRRQIYKELGVAQERSCKLDRRLALGAGTTLGANTRLRNSVVGRNCHIGDGVTLDGAYLFEGVTVGSNCSIVRSILGKGVQINSGVTIAKGCLIGDNCVIGPDIAVPPFSKVVNVPQTNPNLGRPAFGAHAYTYVDEFSEDDEDYEQSFNLTQLARDLPPVSAQEDELTDAESGMASEDDEERIEDARAQEFEREARMTVERALKEGLTVDNALLELTALRMSYNAQFIQVRECVIPQLLQHLDPGRPMAAALKSLLSKWAPLIQKFTLSEYDMVDAIDILLASCADHQHSAKLFALALSQLYDLDILAEDAILSWYHNDDPDRLSDRLADYAALRAAAKPFVDWLNEAEEEDSD
ncbi:translation initiation factor eIF-2B epsilon subunit, GEF [Massospora cicadina]|nr:translation initiation factor eIF-2B epsilon subunit, GEF [Massospora cicadina]